jgi:hypothetical protein
MLTDLSSHLGKQALENGDMKAYAHHSAFSKGIKAAHEAYLLCSNELTLDVQKHLDEIRREKESGPYHC